MCRTSRISLRTRQPDLDGIPRRMDVDVLELDCCICGGCMFLVSSDWTDCRLVVASQQLDRRIGAAMVQQRTAGPLIDPARGLPRKQPLRDAEPSLGDRVLLYRHVETLERVLQREKTMEVRHIACSPGSTWLAAGGEIHGWGVLGDSFVPECLEEFRDDAGEHRAVVDALPYKRTHLWPITDSARLAQPVPFRRLRGPTTWVGFCPVASRVQDRAYRGGLANVGQSCFINAALQGLYSSSVWRQTLKLEGNDVASELWQVWREMTAVAVTKPEPILRRWYHGVQEDSFEFLCGVADAAGLTDSTQGVEQFYLRCAGCRQAFRHGACTAMSEMQMELPSGVEDLQGVVENYFSPSLAPENVKYRDRRWQCPHCESTALPSREHMLNGRQVFYWLC